MIAIGAVAVLLAVSVPVVSAALGSAAPSLGPLSGDVAGAQQDAPAAQGSLGEAPAAQASGLPGSEPPRPGEYVSTVTLVRVTDADARGQGRRVAPAVDSLTGYQWPIQKGRITLPFKAIPGGEFSNGGKLFHDGVDMASFCGAPVVAAHSGIVLAAGRHFDVFIGWVGDLRLYYRRLDSSHVWNELPIVVVIDDGNGYRSMYAHFRDVTVRAGQSVQAGQLIGHEGATGHASGCHVHYGLFSPLTTKLFGVRADIIKRMKVPPHEIARIDPLAVLPGGDVALRTRSIAKAILASRLGG